MPIPSSTPETPIRTAAPWGLWVVLTLQSILFWALVLRAHPIATAGMECAVGAFVETVIHEPAWDLLDAAPGAVGGGVVAAVAALPWTLLTGSTGWALKIVAWMAALLVPAAVYGVARRALRPAAATLTAAAAAFPAPIALHSMLVAGNWHWTQLVFDWGALWLAVRLVERPSPLRAALLGAASTIGLYNSPGSLPFLAIALVVSAILTRPRPRLPAVLGFLGGALPGLLVLAASLSHRPLGATIMTAGKDPILARLSTIHFDASRLPGLLSPDLPWAMHLHDMHPRIPVSFAWGIEQADVLLAWLGAAALGVFAVSRWWKERSLAPLVWSISPLLFIGAFVMAYVLVATRIEIGPLLWSELREESHRGLPPLLVALAVAAAWGWGALAQAARFRALAAGLYLVAAVPAGVGALGGVASLHSLALPGFRAPPKDAACFDTVAIFAVQRGADPAQVRARCQELSTPSRQADCRTGVGLGIGFEAARIGPAPGRPPGDPHGGPCDRIPPDFRARCLPWARGDAPAFAESTRSTCAGLPEQEQEACWIGAGWFASQLVWAKDGWPMAACTDLPSRERRACGMGMGFQLGDHMTPMPWKLRQLLHRAPVAERADLARGCGFAISRSRTLEVRSAELCAAMGADAAAMCRDGVVIARRLRQEENR